MASKTKHSETMEEVMNSMKHAFELSRNLESELPNMANQPHMLSLSIENVVQAFSVAKEKLLMTMMMMSSQQDQTITTATTSFVPMLSHDAKMGATTSIQEWHQLFHMQQPFDVRSLIENKMMIGGVDLAQQLRYNNRSNLEIGEMGGRDMEGSTRSKGPEGDVKKIEASSSPRPRKRKNDSEKKSVEQVPAPQVGNTEMPPEDGFTWRKYGQKEILDKKYPRSYYRCTHQKLYGCPAKKQVQKLDHNPNILEVTYRGEHICHKSSTSPSFHPPPPMTQSTISHSSSISVSGWLSSMNLSLSGGGSMAPTGGAGASSSADPSNSKYGTEYDMVADMVDVMFNSGSSSGNSMESLFPPPEDKWEPSEKKR